LRKFESQGVGDEELLNPDSSKLLAPSERAEVSEQMSKAVRPLSGLAKTLKDSGIDIGGIPSGDRGVVIWVEKEV